MATLSYQLYSSRNFGPIGATFAMLAKAGFSHVEGFGGLYPDHAATLRLRGALEAAGLTMSSGHIALDALRASPGCMVELAQTLGMTQVFAPFLPPADRPKTASDWHAFGAELHEIGKPFRDVGLTFGWHNHDFECVDLGGGDTPLDLILQASDATMLELDVAWVARAGADPMTYITRYADRIVAAHVKDIAPDGTLGDEDGWADPGQGILDWPALLSALGETAARHFVAEHDNPNDDARFARRSHAFLQSVTG